MKKKFIFFLLGGTVLSGILYYLYTINKIKDIEDDTLEEDDTDDIEIEFEEDFDLNDDEEDNDKIIHFDKVSTDTIFQDKSEPSVLDDISEEALDYDSAYFELVCNVTRDEAIQLILKERDDYTIEELVVMTNSELADLYSKILTN